MQAGLMSALGAVSSNADLTSCRAFGGSCRSDRDRLVLVASSDGVLAQLTRSWEAATLRKRCWSRANSRNLNEQRFLETVSSAHNPKVVGSNGSEVVSMTVPLLNKGSLIMRRTSCVGNEQFILRVHDH